MDQSRLKGASGGALGLLMGAIEARHRNWNIEPRFSSTGFRPTEFRPGSTLFRLIRHNNNGPPQAIGEVPSARFSSCLLV